LRAGSLLASKDSELSLFAFCAEGFSADQVSTIVVRHPMLLTLSLEDKLKLILAALERVLGTPADVVQAVSKAAGLVAMALDTIDSNLSMMRGFRLSAGEIRQSVMKHPQLFNWDCAGEVMQAKFRYFEAGSAGVAPQGGVAWKARLPEKQLARHRLQGGCKGLEPASHCLATVCMRRPEM
jgi:hypothetical protein